VGDGGRVLIAGGGIAGLAVGIALQRRGVPVAVFERRAVQPDAGLALNLPGNAVTALRALGIADDLASMGSPVHRREYRNRRGRLLFAVDEDAFWRAEAGPRCVPRGALHAALSRRLAAGTLRLGAEVRGLDQFERGVAITLADGTREEGAALVGADGVRSVVRRLVGDDRPVVAATLSRASWRFVTENRGVDCWVAWTGRAGTVLFIPVGGDRLYGWLTADGGLRTFAEAAGAFTDFPRIVCDTLVAAAGAAVQPLHSPLEEVRPAAWTTGRTILVGDAAHATAPVWAQGAALAAEDALVLAELLTDQADWTRLGGQFAARRRSRVEHVQTMTDRFARVARLPPWLRDLAAPRIGPRTYQATFAPLRDGVV
jgi:2-polyprenyl-6-methoxyphenol hydroxylase-like FAD-dependent oxidoreductase